MAPENPIRSVNTGLTTINVLGDPSAFHLELAHAPGEAGVDLLHLTLTASAPAVLPSLRLEWFVPAHNLVARWFPWAEFRRGLPVWGEAEQATAASLSAPVACLHGFDGRNRLTFAISDTIHGCRIITRVDEIQVGQRCGVGLFDNDRVTANRYELTLRLDWRDQPYWQALASVCRWWESLPDMTPTPVPMAARVPTYCTWYSFHRNLTDAHVEKQAALARQTGFDAIIVDDGWQVAGDPGSHSGAGDWEPCPAKFADMAAHVKRVQAMGMKYLLWYGVAFMGGRARRYADFEHMLFPSARFKSIVDMRFPQVRRYLADRLEAGVREWNLDGLKIDFLDYMVEIAPKGDKLPYGGGRDFDSVPEAIIAFLAETMPRLHRLKPDLLVEFRQRYTGPRMRAYGNMFRALDCPNDPLANRLRILDTRLLAGASAVHSDMIQWNVGDSPQCAALHLYNTIFSVPQISVLLERLSDDHLTMLRSYLNLWTEHRDVLLDGTLMPSHPEMLYPAVTARTADKLAATAYAPCVLSLDSAPRTCLLVNATLQPHVYVETNTPLKPRQLRVFDCLGRIVLERSEHLTAGVHRLPVPPAGVAVLREN